jgi:hypothetical protein
MVVATVHAGGEQGLGWSYAPAGAQAVITEMPSPCVRLMRIVTGAANALDVTSITSHHVYPPRVGHTLLVRESPGSKERF